MPYSANAPIHSTPIREDQNKSGVNERNENHVRFFES